MPTMRSKFNIEQFERVLQKLAHELPRFHRVSTDDMTIAFYYNDEGEKIRRIRVELHGLTGKKTKWGPEREYCNFSIEPKLYTTSEDSTKIGDYYKEKEQKIKEFIEKIMASEKPIPIHTITEEGLT